MNNKKIILKIFSLIFNLTIIILEIIALFLTIKSHDLELFQYYTDNSNIFALIVCVIFLVFNIICLFKKGYVIPKWVIILKFSAVCCLLVTFFITVFVLSPLGGIEGFMHLMFYNAMFYHHLICPILAFVSFVFFERNFNLTFKSTFFALIPTLIYGLIMLTLNIVKIIEGPYPFLYVYFQPWWATVLWMIAIVVLSYLIACFVYICSKTKRKNTNKGGIN